MARAARRQAAALRSLENLSVFGNISKNVSFFFFFAPDVETRGFEKTTLVKPEVDLVWTRTGLSMAFSSGAIKNNIRAI